MRKHKDRCFGFIFTIQRSLHVKTFLSSYLFMIQRSVHEKTVFWSSYLWSNGPYMQILFGLHIYDPTVLTCKDRLVFIVVIERPLHANTVWSSYLWPKGPYMQRPFCLHITCNDPTVFICKYRLVVIFTTQRPLDFHPGWYKPRPIWIPMGYCRYKISTATNNCTPRTDRSDR